MCGAHSMWPSPLMVHLRGHTSWKLKFVEQERVERSLVLNPCTFNANPEGNITGVPGVLCPVASLLRVAWVRKVLAWVRKVCCTLT